MKAKRTKYSSNPFTQMVNRQLPQLMAADLVLVMLPSGQEVIAKGVSALHGIQAQGQARSMVIVRLNASSIEEAAALDTVLGNDGFYTNPNSQQVGHA